MRAAFWVASLLVLREGFALHLRTTASSSAADDGNVTTAEPQQQYNRTLASLVINRTVNVTTSSGLRPSRMNAYGSLAQAATSSMNTIMLSDYRTYALLSNADPTSGSRTTQSNWITLNTAEWELAPDTDAIRAMIQPYPWSTDVIVLASGVGLRTTNFAPAGQPYGDWQMKFAQNGNSYMCPWYNYQILIRRLLPIAQYQTHGAESTTVTPLCNGGQVISTSGAIYGTVTGQYPAVSASPSCSLASAMTKVQALCDGKASCTIAVGNDVMGGDPCPWVGKTLVVNWACVQPTPCSCDNVPCGQCMTGCSPSTNGCPAGSSRNWCTCNLYGTACGYTCPNAAAPPTIAPTQLPTITPIANPTIAPTRAPIAMPTLVPTKTPTFSPTVAPSLQPTLQPTQPCAPGSVLTATDCPAGYTKMPNGGGCLLYGAGPLSWADAARACAANGGWLATVHNEAENLAIPSLAGSSDVWIGLNDIANSGQMVQKGSWARGPDGTNQAYRNWYPNEPNNMGGHEDCTMLYALDARWNDDSCSAPKGFVCQASPQYQCLPPPPPPSASVSPCPAGQVVNGTVCPSGYVLAPSGGSCLKYAPATATWFDAYRTCSAAGGWLAQVHSAADNAYMASVQQGAAGVGYGAWIGLNDIATEGQMAWQHDDGGTGYANFAPGEPNNAGSDASGQKCSEECVLIYTDTGGWNDLRCNAVLAFWCQAALVPGCAAAPSSAPVAAPTLWPTLTPTLTPSQVPTQPPSNAPVPSPTLRPSPTPTLQPSNKNAAPAVGFAPTPWPTLTPTLTPSQQPSQPPSDAPVPNPTLRPTATPTQQPSSLTPTPGPTLVPTTARPSLAPSMPPVQQPTPLPTTSALSASLASSPSLSPVRLSPPTPAPFAQASTFDVAKWHVGDGGQSCDGLCSSLGLVPDAAQEVTLTSPAFMDAIAAKNGYACSVYLPSSQPYIEKTAMGCQFLLAGLGLDASWSSSLPPVSSGGGLCACSAAAVAAVPAPGPSQPSSPSTPTGALAGAVVSGVVVLGLVVCCVMARKAGSVGAGDSSSSSSSGRSKSYEAPAQDPVNEGPPPSAPSAPVFIDQEVRIIRGSPGSIVLQEGPRPYTPEDKTGSSPGAIEIDFDRPSSAEFTPRGSAGGGRTSKPAPTRKCTVCLDEGAEGLECNLGHFICKTNGCVGGMVRDQIQSHGTFRDQNNCQVYCIMCLRSKDVDLGRLSALTVEELCANSPSAVSEYFKACTDVAVVAAADEVRRAYERKMKEQISLKEQRIQQHRLFILESILCDRCPSPKCGHVLDLDTFDFSSNCLALKCQNCPNKQQCCGWCFQLCGADAHPHVKTCPLNPTADKNYFTDRNSYFLVQRTRKRGKIEAYLQAEVAAELRPDVRASVAMQTDPLGQRYLPA